VPNFIEVFQVVRKMKHAEQVSPSPCYVSLYVTRASNAYIRNYEEKIGRSFLN